ncbi:MAG: cytochrome c-type biogenesis protein CcmH [Planctomycetes bacterium]|nr:cytochrome c-type biogenesis protein CcmH [Planctomycetota bacterium]
MWAWRARPLAAALVVAAVLGGVAASAQEEAGPPEAPPDEAHAGGGEVRLGELPPEARRRVRGLWARLCCACPSESWSRTLANCPDGCADAQKGEVVRAVAQGATDGQVLEAQRSRHGPQVLAAPEAEGSAAWVYWAPFLLLLGGAGLVAGVLARWRRGAMTGAAGAALVQAEAPRGEELDAVERELEGMD